MSTYPVAAPAGRHLPLWLALVAGAVILVLALVAGALDVRPAPVVGIHVGTPYLPTEHLTQDLRRWPSPGKPKKPATWGIDRAGLAAGPIVAPPPPESDSTVSSRLRSP